MFSLFIGMVFGMLLGCEWVDIQWGCISLFGLGCVGTALLMIGGCCYWVSVGAALWGTFVATFFVYSIEQDRSALLGVGEQGAVVLKCNLQRRSPPAFVPSRSESEPVGNPC